MISNIKICRKCKIEFPLSMFYKHKGMKDGYLNICKNCKRNYAIKYQQSLNKEKLREYKKQWKSKNKDKIKEPLLKCNCRRYTINKVRRGQIIRPNKCNQCGVKCKPNAHHPDYSNHHLVEWLCISCHKKKHYPRLVGDF